MPFGQPGQIASVTLLDDDLSYSGMIHRIEVEHNGGGIERVEYQGMSHFVQVRPARMIVTLSIEVTEGFVKKLIEKHPPAEPVEAPTPGSRRVLTL